MNRRPRVAVAVATYRRPEMLAALLQSLAEQDTTEPFEVIVVDNDPDASALPMVRRRADTLPFRVLALHEPEPGISAARNRALDAALEHDFIAFIDDDEVADPLWLSTLLAVQRNRAASGVSGPVRYHYGTPPPSWALRGGFYMEPGFRDGDVIPMAGTNNLLLDLHALRERGLRFEPTFGLIGGSDIVLTRALTDSGAVLVWADDAVVQEDVPPERCTARWAVRRAVRTGNSYGLMHLHRVSQHARTRRVAVRGMLLVTGTARILVGAARLAVHPRISVDAVGAGAFRTLLRGVGVLGAAVGLRVAEYARTRAADA